MVNITKKDWLIIVIGAIATYFAPAVIGNILSFLSTTIPQIIDWAIKNIVLVVIIAIIVYLVKKDKK